MKNLFYNDFDMERLHKSPREDYRTHFQIDRDRIIHSSEFRRLQGKTQVFLPGEFDYYRTRLTHSIEVAQIARSICSFLKSNNTDLFSDGYFIDQDLVESASLAHDLGHPPFGHAGERTLNKLMVPYGGFEGNAQTLRLITETFYTIDKDKRGLNPTRAFVDSILKYKSLYGQLNNPENHFIYDTQKPYLDFVFNNRLEEQNISPGKSLNSLKSIECQIMDWADDTAYAINDLVDSISGEFITIHKLLNWKEENQNNLTELQLVSLNNIISWIKKGNYKAKFGAEIGNFILATKIEEQDSFMNSFTNRYKYKLIIKPDYIEIVKLYKKLSVDMVFNTAEIHQVEFKGDRMLKSTFEILEDNYIKKLSNNILLPQFTDHLIRKEKDMQNRARLVCDYISGMTDSFAMRTYKRLFDPDYKN